MIAEIVLGLVALGALAALHFGGIRHDRHIQHLLAGQDAERHRWALERNELNTRIQAPEVARVSPPAPPPSPATEDVLRHIGLTIEPEDDGEPDESDLIGVVVGLGGSDGE